MTVRELIQTLGAYDGEMVVWIEVASESGAAKAEPDEFMVEYGELVIGGSAS